jgi:hypothetical protein
VLLPKLNTHCRKLVKIAENCDATYVKLTPGVFKLDEKNGLC